VSDEKVIKDVISEDAWTIIFLELSKQNINSEVLSNVSALLGKQVSANHQMRTKSKRCDAAELELVLFDWYMEEMKSMSKEQALRKLIDIFNSTIVSCPVVSRELSKLLPAHEEKLSFMGRFRQSFRRKKKK